jgi:hypothetical protein
LKRIIAAAALAALVATPAVGHTAPKKVKRVERKVTFDYTGFCVAGIDGGNAGLTGCPTASMHETVKKGEAYVKYFATDATGQKIGITAYDPAAYSTTAATVCGGLAKAKKIKAGVNISLVTMANPTCGGPVATTGTMTMVFSNLP